MLGLYDANAAAAMLGISGVFGESGPSDTTG